MSRSDSGIKAVITNIQRYCYHDGPGIRTTVFFKGCSLRCQWCSNPENISPGKDTSEEAQSKTGGKVWPCLGGRSVSIDSLAKELMKDELFFMNSGGGVTASGGEPLLQADFVSELFRVLRELGISTAVETAGNVPWEDMEKVLYQTDYLIYDVKLVDTAEHKLRTGSGNERIIKNLFKVSQVFPDLPILVRTPTIRGINDGEDHVRAVLKLIDPIKNIVGYELLPYHRLGLGKYKELRLSYELTEAEAPDEDRMKLLNSIIENRYKQNLQEEDLR